MTYAAFFRLLRRRIGADSDRITDQSLVDLINLCKIEIEESIIIANPRALGVSFTIDLEDNVREYKLPFEINEDNVFYLSAVLGGNEIPLKKLTYGGEYNGSMDEDYIKSRFSNVE